MDDTEVLVIGGGPAGAAAAIVLARAGRRCVVLEGQPAPGWKIGETLAPESRPLLQALGVWEPFQQDGHRPSPGNGSAWGGVELGAKDFIFNPHGCAWQLDRPRFEAMLLHAAEAAGATVARGVAAQTIRREAGGWEVTANANPCRASWLVDATGRGAMVARQLGVARRLEDKLVAVYAVVSATAETDTDARTLLEAEADGWWYTALMPGGRRVFAWLTDADLLPGHEWREAAWFWRRVAATRCLAPLHAPAGETPAPKLTSAHSGRLGAVHGEGWVATGDAAQSFDPLSGEGLFHALLSGQRAAQGLVGNLSGETNGLGDYAALSESLWRRFLHQRQAAYTAEPRWRDQPFWQRRQRAM